MFPLRWNFPFRKKDGTIVNIEDAMSGGGGGYTLPTASTTTKGGIKVGTGLKMTGDTMSVDIDPELPAYGIAEAGKVLGVDDNGDLAWVTVSGSSAFVRAKTIANGINVSTSAKEGE